MLAQIDADLAASDKPVKVAIRSGNGIGKSTLLSILVLWALLTKGGTRGILTSGTATQLTTKNLATLRDWRRLCAMGDCVRDEQDYRDILDAGPHTAIDLVPWPENRPEAFSGLHARGRRLLSRP